MSQFKRRLRKILPLKKTSKVGVNAKENNHLAIVKAFIAEPANPYLISFPRTGSHWLRMVMELYFERPSLLRAFYYHDSNDYLTLHDHDLKLDIERSSVIYLFRDPVDTIYSQLLYHKEKIDNRIRIDYWSDLYGRHLNKWLHQEAFTKYKTIICYDRLKSNMPEEFMKICAHLGDGFDLDKLNSVSTQVSKEKVKEKTSHDPQVISLSNSYDAGRENFRDKFADIIWRTILHSREYLQKYF